VREGLVRISYFPFHSHHFVLIGRRAGDVERSKASEEGKGSGGFRPIVLNVGCVLTRSTTLNAWISPLSLNFAS